MADRNSRIADVRAYEYELSEKAKETSEAVDKCYAESGRSPTYYTLLGNWKGLNDALTMLENYINGGKLK